MTNQFIVLRLIQKATENKNAETKGILGKKALQKSMYLFNLRHERFYFKWADYGPLSGEIQQIVRDLSYNNKITLTDFEMKNKAVVKNVLFVKDSEKFEGFPEQIDKTLDEIVNLTAGKGPRELELWASVHYWARRQQEQVDKYTVKHIHERLSILKPDAKFTEDDVRRAIEKLEEGQFLNFDQ